MPDNKIPRRRRMTGMLASLPSFSRDNVPFLLNGLVEQQREVSGSVIIHFPAMPDSVDLVRRANYDVTKVYATPDGFHQFTDVDPLEIPFSFKLHAQDPYCDQGGLTILQIAANLHSLSLPIGDSSNYAVSGLSSAAPAPSQDTSEDGNTAAGSTSTTDPSAKFRNVLVDLDVVDRESIAYPVPVYLDLIKTSEDGPGVRCIGYIKDVSAKLLGPFLRPSNGGYNIPSAGEFSFTFVHRPSHSNVLGSGAREFHAYAGTVRNSLYNTRHLAFKDRDYRVRGMK